jgi:integrase
LSKTAASGRTPRWADGRPHDLRHTAATAWLAAGVDAKTVQACLGHASGELTLNLYGYHPGTDAHRAGIARVSAIFGDATGTWRQGSSKRNSTPGDGNRL